MPAHIVRADYDQLNHMTGAFAQEAELTRKALQQIRGCQDTLAGGDWVGQGANGFYAEMNGQVVPTLNRLARALEAASGTTRQIRAIMKAAEDEAARYLNQRGGGAVPVGANPPGVGLAGVGAALGGAVKNASGIGAALGAIDPGSGFGAPAAGPVLGEGMKSFVAKPAPAGKVKVAPPHAGVNMFGGASDPIPVPRGVQPYNQVPNRDGNGFKNGGGNSPAVTNWGLRFKQVGPMIEAQRQMLNKLKDQLNAKIQQHTAKVVAASRNMAANVQKLNTLTDGKAFELIKQHQQLGRDAQTADVRAQSAMKRAQAALEQNKAAQAAIEEHTKGIERQSLTDKKAAIEAKIAQRKEVIGKIVGVGKAAATGGPAGAAAAMEEISAELVTEIVGGMTSAEAGELGRLAAQIEAVNEAVAKATDTKLKSDLLATKSQLEASFDDVVAAKLTARNAEMAQMDTLDQLAALEAGNKTGRMFQELRDYNSAVLKAGNELRARSQDYIRALEKTPGIGDAGTIAARVADDRYIDQVYGKNNQDWQEQASQTENYLYTLERWSQGEIASHNDLVATLGRGGHGDFTNGVILAADEALGGTALNRQTVRQGP